LPIPCSREVNLRFTVAFMFAVVVGGQSFDSPSGRQRQRQRQQQQRWHARLSSHLKQILRIPEEQSFLNRLRGYNGTVRVVVVRPRLRRSVSRAEDWATTGTWTPRFGSMSSRLVQIKSTLDIGVCQRGRVRYTRLASQVNKEQSNKVGNRSCRLQQHAARLTQPLSVPDR
jgi:hypothetical protein